MAKRSVPSLEDIAAEVGRLFGTTEAHTRRWLEQRGTMLEALHLVRDKASELIGELSGEKRRQFKRQAQARARRTQLPTGTPADLTMGRKRRRVSGATKTKLRATRKTSSAGVRKRSARKRRT
jgi:hypothetical protein